MAKKSQIAKTKRTPKFSSRKTNRCGVCGRPRAFSRRYGVCRICLRELAKDGKIPGLVKSSW